MSNYIPIEFTARAESIMNIDYLIARFDKPTNHQGILIKTPH